MFLVELVCCLSVRPSDCMKSNQRFSEVCLEPRNNWLDFEGDTDYDPDPDLTDLHET